MAARNILELPVRRLDHASGEAPANGPGKGGHTKGPKAGGDIDEACIAAAVRGDRQAIQSLFLTLLPRIRNLVRYLVRGDVEVDDIAQDVLIGILRSLSSFRNEGPFKAWVDRIVVRVVFAHIRRRQQDAEEVSEDVPALDPPLGPEFLARRRLVALLDELPLEQRQALVLHHVLEMSVPEIAAQCQVPIETVRSRLRVGRTRLRERGLGLDTPTSGRGS